MKNHQIAGIGSMVYTALVVTPKHDVLSGVALLFFVAAMLASSTLCTCSGGSRRGQWDRVPRLDEI